MSSTLQRCVQGRTWLLFRTLSEGAAGDTHCLPLDFLQDVGRFVACSEKHQRKQMHRHIQKTHRCLFSFAGCLLDYLKTEEGSQLNLPKLIDMSAQVSDQPLVMNWRPSFVFVPCKFKVSLCQHRVSQRKTAPPGMLSEGSSLSPHLNVHVTSAMLCWPLGSLRGT